MKYRARVLGCVALLLLAESATDAQTITEIIDATGLDGPWGVAADGAGNVYVTGRESNNVFKVTPGGAVTWIIDIDGDGTHSLEDPAGVAVDVAGNLYVTGSESDNVFKVTPGGTVTQIIDRTGDGTHGLRRPAGVAVDVAGNLYATGYISDNAFKVTPGGAVSSVAGLIVPGFEVAVDDPEGPTTFYAVRNTSDQQVFGRVDFFGGSSLKPLRTDAFAPATEQGRP